MQEPPYRPPLAHSPLSVILIAERSLAVTQAAFDAWRGYLSYLARPYEILLVRPNATVTEPFGTAVRVCRYDPLEGYGQALHMAIAASRYPLLVFCTADAQYQPADLGQMLARIDQGDLVLGYRSGLPIPGWRKSLDRGQRLFVRALLGDWTEPRRHWLGRAGWKRRWVARWIFGLRLTDVECPYRLARRELMAELPLQSHGPFVQVEILAKLNFLPCILAGEVPVAWTLPPGEMPGETAGATFAQEARALFRNPVFRTLPQATNEEFAVDGSRLAQVDVELVEPQSTNEKPSVD